MQRPLRHGRTLVDPCHDHLRRRLAAEPDVAVTRLLDEIRELGYTGSANLLVRYLNHDRAHEDRQSPPRREVDRARSLTAELPEHDCGHLEDLLNCPVGQGESESERIIEFVLGLAELVLPVDDTSGLRSITPSRMAWSSTRTRIARLFRRDRGATARISDPATDGAVGDALGEDVDGEMTQSRDDATTPARHAGIERLGLQARYREVHHRLAALREGSWSAVIG